MTRVYLFTDVFTYNWGWASFDALIAFCKAHRIDGVQLKVYELTQGEWYAHLGGATKVIGYLRNHGLDVLPYGYFYGVTSNELTYAWSALTAYGKFCMNCEDTWNNNPSFARTLRNALANHPGELWISTWADPKTQGWLTNIAILDDIVAVWQPEEYGDNLIDLRLSEFPPVRGRILPTYSINPAVTVSRMLVADGISIWEYADALGNVTLLDAMIAHLQPQSTPPPMLWFQYPIGVPFGDPNYDVALNGSHDLTLLAFPNVPVTALVSGVISSITSPPWGKQVGVHLDIPVAAHGWMSYLHLSAVNPSLSVGNHVSRGDLVGWVGGANTEGQYLGTTNPTGVNFLNTPEMSSQVQVGIALMDGPEYWVGSGWSVWPPIDTTLDPSSLLRIINYIRDAFETEWTAIMPSAMTQSGIAS